MNCRFNKMIRIIWILCVLMRESTRCCFDWNYVDTMCIDAWVNAMLFWLELYGYYVYWCVSLRDVVLIGIMWILCVLMRESTRCCFDWNYVDTMCIDAWVYAMLFWLELCGYYVYWCVSLRDVVLIGIMWILCVLMRESTRCCFDWNYVDTMCIDAWVYAMLFWLELCGYYVYWCVSLRDVVLIGIMWILCVLMRESTRCCFDWNYVDTMCIDAWVYAMLFWLELCGYYVYWCVSLRDVVLIGIMWILCVLMRESTRCCFDWNYVDTMCIDAWVYAMLFWLELCGYYVYWCVSLRDVVLIGIMWILCVLMRESTRCCFDWNYVDTMCIDAWVYAMLFWLELCGYYVYWCVSLRDVVLIGIMWILCVLMRESTRCCFDWNYVDTMCIDAWVYAMLFWLELCGYYVYWCVSLRDVVLIGIMWILCVLMRESTRCCFDWNYVDTMCIDAWVYAMLFWLELCGYYVYWCVSLRDVVLIGIMWILCVLMRESTRCCFDWNYVDTMCIDAWVYAMLFWLELCGYYVYWCVSLRDVVLIGIMWILCVLMRESTRCCFDWNYVDTMCIDAWVYAMLFWLELCGYYVYWCVSLRDVVLIGIMWILCVLMRESTRCCFDWNYVDTMCIDAWVYAMLFWLELCGYYVYWCVSLRDVVLIGIMWILCVLMRESTRCCFDWNYVDTMCIDAWVYAMLFWLELCGYYVYWCVSLRDVVLIGIMWILCVLMRESTRCCFDWNYVDTMCIDAWVYAMLFWLELCGYYVYWCVSLRDVVLIGIMWILCVLMRESTRCCFDWNYVDTMCIDAWVYAMLFWLELCGYYVYWCVSLRDVVLIGIMWILCVLMRESTRCCFDWNYVDTMCIDAWVYAMLFWLELCGYYVYWCVSLRDVVLIGIMWILCVLMRESTRCCFDWNYVDTMCIDAWVYAMLFWLELCGYYVYWCVSLRDVVLIGIMWILCVLMRESTRCCFDWNYVDTMCIDAWVYAMLFWLELCGYYVYWCVSLRDVVLIGIMWILCVLMRESTRCCFDWNYVDTMCIDAWVYAMLFWLELCGYYVYWCVSLRDVVLIGIMWILCVLMRESTRCCFDWNYVDTMCIDAWVYAMLFWLELCGYYVYWCVSLRDVVLIGIMWILCVLMRESTRCCFDWNYVDTMCIDAWVNAMLFWLELCGYYVYWCVSLRDVVLIGIMWKLCVLMRESTRCCFDWNYVDTMCIDAWVYAMLFWLELCGYYVYWCVSLRDVVLIGIMWILCVLMRESTRCCFDWNYVDTMCIDAWVNAMLFWLELCGYYVYWCVSLRDVVLIGIMWILCVLMRESTRCCFDWNYVDTMCIDAWVYAMLFWLELCGYYVYWCVSLRDVVLIGIMWILCVLMRESTRCCFDWNYVDTMCIDAWVNAMLFWLELCGYYVYWCVSLRDVVLIGIMWILCVLMRESTRCCFDWNYVDTMCIDAWVYAMLFWLELCGYYVYWCVSLRDVVLIGIMWILCVLMRESTRCCFDWNYVDTMCIDAWVNAMLFRLELCGYYVYWCVSLRDVVLIGIMWILCVLMRESTRCCFDKREDWRIIFNSLEIHAL